MRKPAQDGHETVYVPCHRSHMDYLLLSYVLYHEGMVPPHIAAGINLNFFPAGPIFAVAAALSLFAAALKVISSIPLFSVNIWQNCFPKVTQWNISVKEAALVLVVCCKLKRACWQ